MCKVFLWHGMVWGKKSNPFWCCVYERFHVWIKIKDNLCCETNTDTSIFKTPFLPLLHQFFLWFFWIDHIFITLQLQTDTFVLKMCALTPLLVTLIYFLSCTFELTLACILFKLFILSVVHNMWMCHGVWPCQFWLFHWHNHHTKNAYI